MTTEGDNPHTRLMAENDRLRAENVRLRRHRALLRPFAARVLKEFWQEVQRQSEISLVFRLTLVVEQTPLVESAVAAMIETDPERDTERYKPVNIETIDVAALCAAEAFLGAEEECQRLRKRLAEAEYEAVSRAERCESLFIDREQAEEELARVEAEAAAMREVLQSYLELTWRACEQFVEADWARRDSYWPVGDRCVLAQDALSADAGRNLLERLRAAEERLRAAEERRSLGNVWWRR